jgi:hypothetical protein
MNIDLYCAVSRLDEARQIPRDSMQQSRRFAKLMIGSLAWRWFRRLWINTFDVHDFDSSNVGDVAIRNAIQTMIENRWAKDHLTFRSITWGDVAQLMEAGEDGTGGLIVVAGSGYLAVDKDGSMAKRIDADLDLFESLPPTQPVIALGIGVNRPGETASSTDISRLPRETIARIKRFCDVVPVIGVRDEPSRRVIKHASPASDPLVVGDPALFAAPKGWHRRRPSRGSTARIGVNIAFHGPMTARLVAAELPRISQALVRLQRESGAVISYFKHHDGERLMPSLLRDVGLRIANVYRASPESLLEGYAEQDLHIGMMLHSCILASSVGTPSIGIAYDSKTFGFFDLMGMPGNCVHLSEWSAEWLLARAKAVLAERDTISEQLARRRRELSRQWDALFERVEMLPGVNARRALGQVGRERLAVSP